MELKQIDSSRAHQNYNVMSKRIIQPRCLATLPNNIEELLCQFKMQGKGLLLNPQLHLQSGQNVENGSTQVM